MVILYFACFALAWTVLAVLLVAAPVAELPPGSLRLARPPANPTGLLLALAAHAALVAGLAWQAQRWLFAHGPLAVALSGAPLFALFAELWFVAAFLYVIAVLHVWLACRHESIGRLQAPHSPSAGSIDSRCGP
jgi:hypothetical protein